MKFAQFYYAYGIWAVFILVLFFIFAFRGKRAALRQFADEGLLPELASLVNFKRQIMKFSLIILVFMFGLLALMRPQWGFRWQEIKRVGLDIIVAIDTSKSMLATDLKPNRLQRSKLAVWDLVKKLKGDRIGLIAFSGTAFLQCPLTVDYDGFLLALNDLDVDTIPRGGTSIASAIRTALRSYEGGQNKYKILIIITDGEDHEGGAVELAEEAKKQGLKIFCVGVGSTEGELIQLVDEAGHRTFLKDREGNVVKSRLDEGILREIALTTGATYVRSGAVEFGLDLIYDERLSKMEKREIKTQMAKMYDERFQIPLGIAFILLIIEPFINEKKKA